MRALQIGGASRAWKAVSACNARTVSIAKPIGVFIFGTAEFGSSAAVFFEVAGSAERDVTTADRHKKCLPGRPDVQTYVASLRS